MIKYIFLLQVSVQKFSNKFKTWFKSQNLLLVVWQCDGVDTGVTLLVSVNMFEVWQIPYFDKTILATGYQIIAVVARVYRLLWKSYIIFISKTISFKVNLLDFKLIESLRKYFVINKLKFSGENKLEFCHCSAPLSKRFVFRSWWSCKQSTIHTSQWPCRRRWTTSTGVANIPHCEIKLCCLMVRTSIIQTVIFALKLSLIVNIIFIQYF